MTNSIKTDDIKFQPEVPRYSYSSRPEVKKKIIKNVNTFFTLSVRIFLILLLFLILLVSILGILNYFSVVSLSNVSPALSNLPKLELTNEEIIEKIKPEKEKKPYNIPGTNAFIAEGTLQKYSQNMVTVRFGKINIELEYTHKTPFFLSKTQTIDLIENPTPSIERISNTTFASNVLKPENINKKVFIQYTEEKDKNILESFHLLID